MASATLKKTIIQSTVDGASVKASVVAAPAITAKLHAGPPGEKGSPGEGAAMRTAITGTNNVGWDELTGLTDGSNSVFEIEGSFAPGKAWPYLAGSAAVRLTEFTPDPANGRITLPFNPTDPVMLDYVPA